MARYIDADELLKKLPNDLPYKASVKRVLIQAPEADVVPKSEVDRLETEVRLLTENSISAKYPCCVSTSKGLILTKSLEEYDKLLADIASEVAREIFEEIEKCMEHDYISSIGVYNGALELRIAELKKKYTEEQK